MKTKALSILMAIFLAFSVSTVSMAFAADVSSATTLLTASKKKTVKLSAKKATIYYKGTKTLKLLNNKKKVKWYTSNKKVATVSSKGKVTAKGLGTAKITAKVGSKKYTCKVTVKDRNVGTAIGFVTDGGGYFIKGESVAKVTIRPKKYDCAKAVVSIKDAAGDTVYTKTYKNLKKNTNYSFTWDAKDNKGNELPSGSYMVSVKIGKTVSNSAYLSYLAVNDFADGNGSASNPFELNATTHLPKIVKYPDANFKQTENFDYCYESIGGFFSEDKPFEGVYDGNGKTISNISATMPLFNTIGENGVVKNVVMVECNVINEREASLLAKNNYGKIMNCSVDVNASAATTSQTMSVGSLTMNNYGVISKCTAIGNISAIANGPYGIRPVIGGIASFNAKEGKIIDCVSETNIKTTPGVGDSIAYCGGIAGKNEGLISGCEATGELIFEKKYSTGGVRFGGVVGLNDGQVISSNYTGSSSVNTVGINNGTIV